MHLLLMERNRWINWCCFSREFLFLNYFKIIIVLGTCITVLDMHTSAVKDSVNIDGALYGLPIFNIVHICLVDEEHIAVILRGTHDVLLIFSLTKKNVLSYEEIENDFVKCVVASSDQIFIGYQSGSCQRIHRKHFLKGKLKEGITIKINSNRQVSSITFNDQHILVACGGYMYMYDVDFNSTSEPGAHVKRPHGEQYIQELVVLPDKKRFLVSFQCCPEIHLFDFKTLDVLKVVNFRDIIKKLNPFAESSDMRVTSMCPFYDVVWVATGSGHILIYSIDSVTNELNLLTTLHPYKMELRKLCLWKMKPNNLKVKHLVIATGKELNPEIFGKDALCPLNSYYVDETVEKRTAVKVNPAAVTSLKDVQPMPGKIVLMWQAADATEMKKILSR